MSESQYSPRKTRSRTKPIADKRSIQTEETAVSSSSIDTKDKTSTIAVLSTNLTSKATKLSKKDHILLLHKERWLRTNTISIPRGGQNLQPAIDATLVFAQEEAGTAVCVSDTGLLLTCSHCVAESVEEYDEDKSHWLLFSSGRVVETKCVAWDAQRDLALLRIVAAQKIEGASSSSGEQEFPFISLAESTPKRDASLGCIGHPGSEDLEASLPGAKTNYDVLHVSVGAFRGYAVGQDLQDNSEIGALEHDCWTYWGHSGAPLVDRRTERLVGLHSSWDEETRMRRGIPLEAVRSFMERNVERA
jgi:hypothetical protein